MANAKGSTYDIKPKPRHRQVFEKVIEKGGNIAPALREAGYSEAVVDNPKKVTETKGWKQLLDEYLSETELAEKHRELLRSTRLDHMVFPLGPKSDKEREVVNKLPENLATILDAEMAMRNTTLSDDEIKEMLAEVNCKVRRIVHGETARHVYFWAADNKARKEALDMAFKLRGAYAPEKKLNVNLELNANATPEARNLAEEYEERLRNSLMGTQEDVATG